MKYVVAYHHVSRGILDGMGSSVNRREKEHTAMISAISNGELTPVWVEEITIDWTRQLPGASARRIAVKQDDGDTLELAVRVTEEAKPEVMREIARQLVHEARAAIEHAASNGEQPPVWVQTFMSPAGWEHYSTLREEAGHPDQAALAIT